MTDDVYVTHPDVAEGAYVPRSSLRQLGTQGWSESQPPPPVKTHADTDLADSTTLVLISHPDLADSAWVPETSLDQHLASGWVEGPRVDQPVTANEPGTYDPGAHNLDGDDGVLAYLAAASGAERERVIAAERAGKNRTSVVQWEPPADLTEGEQ
jgi:hypothetical protein